MLARTQSEPTPLRQFSDTLLTTILILPLLIFTTPPQATALITADVVALDQQIYYNRLGAVNPHGMIYALRRDVVHFNRPDANVDCAAVAGFDGQPILGSAVAAVPGCVRLRDDKRPRPIVLRVHENEELRIAFQNLLAPVALVVPNPNADVPAAPGAVQFGAQFDDQPHTRFAGIHVQGMQLVGSTLDDGSNVGRNNVTAPGPSGANGLLAPGPATITYHLFAEHEGGYLLESTAAQTGAEGGNGTDSQGLFGMVNVELPDSTWYRSQLTRIEMELASRDTTTGASQTTAGGQPIIGYAARYPTAATDPRLVQMIADGFDIDFARDIASKGKAGLPIIAILDGNAIVHSDLNAIIAGPFGRTEPPNPAYPSRNQSFREFSILFHDEITTVQAFPIYEDPAWSFTLGSVKDGFAINYGTGGIGSEILANRLGLGPMGDCQECKYEEFFLTSWVVGDPAMVVDRTANLSDPANGLIATKALYPEDAANVWPAYLNDRVKIRNLHIGTEHHIFHLHAHQWLFTPDDDNSNYLDAQGIGPGSTYTYEIAYDSGNRNKTPGDAIFHCHFYPHFAQGMWGLYRVHDVFEFGTEVEIDPTDDFPIVKAGSRALPDGEIAAGVPIYSLVPIPGAAIAPMPELNVEIVGGQAQIAGTGINLVDATAGDITTHKLAGDGNPGYPFFIPAIAGHRPPTPPKDLEDDGGLPRHIITTANEPGVNLAQTQTQHSFFKELEEATAQFLAEDGTGVEVAAMDFHGPQPGFFHASFDTAGNAASFEVNGLPPVAGAPYAEPCRPDTFAGGDADVDQNIDRRYKGANIQLDLIMNKVGWHFPQSRIISLWEDVQATLDGTRAPEPFVMRANSGDCIEYKHTNLVPNIYLGDDFQVETPTDVIGQHIHLVKFDVTAADGAANGFNYEDGTLSPGEVHERVIALNKTGTTYPAGHPNAGAPLAEALHPFFQNVPEVQTDFWTGQSLALGARTTIQRWYMDPLVNIDGIDRGLGNVFTHDHYGPSTHQQVGLYATLLSEPTGSVWADNETGEPFNGEDGSLVDITSTSWQAVIEAGGDSYREFYLEFADFAIAYEAQGTPTIVRSETIGEGTPAAPFEVATAALAGNAEVVNPSHRNELGLPDLIEDGVNNGLCGPVLPGQPCPEAVSANDPGTYLVNYRNESVGLRVRDPATNEQAGGTLGDLSFAFRSIDRADPLLNTQHSGEVHPAGTSPFGTGVNLPGVFPIELTSDVRGNDPFTPILRTFANDLVRVRAQVGATEESHWASIYGVNWLMEYFSPDSGFRSSTHAGISEQFQFRTPVIPGPNPAGTTADYFYATSSDTGALWNGDWGVMRAYQNRPPRREPLHALPNNPDPSRVVIENQNEFNGTCPVDANVRVYDVTAVLAQDVLPEVQTGDGLIRTLVYNYRPGAVDPAPPGDTPPLTTPAGPIHDPTAILFVMTEDLVLPPDADPATVDPNTCLDVDGLFDATLPNCCFDAEGTPNLAAVGCPSLLADDAPIEPLILRAAAGECIDFRLRNKLEPDLPNPDLLGDPELTVNNMPDLPGFNIFPAVIDGFNANDVKPSNDVGLHPQLVAVDITRDSGANVGRNPVQTVSPGDDVRPNLWYMGKLALEDGSRPNRKRLVATPVEFGVANLLPSDRLKHSNKGAVGALVVEPAGSTWQDGPGFDELDHITGRRTRAQKTITLADGTSTFRDYVLVIQDDINQRCDNCGDDPLDANAIPVVSGEEEPGDAGNKGYNYRTEPLWFRLGYSPTTPVEQLRERDDLWTALANSTIGGLDPQTPLFTATVGEQARLRVVKPGGNDRANNLTVHGHIWQREPYLAGSDSTVIGPSKRRDVPAADRSFWHGEQGLIGPTSHFDILPATGAGGINGVPGDYLYRDTVPVHFDNGEWGIWRVTAPEE